MITDKQAQAMELIRQGEKPKEAMISAGYSPNTALHPNENLLQLKGPQQIIEQYKAEYLKVGITPAYMVKKTAEWLEATKVKGSFTEPDRTVPDYQTQLKAAEFVRRDFGMEQNVGISINGEKVIAILGGVTNVERDIPEKSKES